MDSLRGGITLEEGVPFAMPACRQRILIAIHSIVITGGFLRFERLGRVLRAWGHEVAFVLMADEPINESSSQLPVLTFAEAAAQRWDAVMVPGAGFPEGTIEKFALLRQENCGVRVQHILNDQSVRPRFKKVNDVFSPHIVIFNNLHWPIGSFNDFKGDRFHTLLGAVDLRIMRPAPFRSHPMTPGKWIVGGQASKSPEPLIEALAELPADVCLRLFGPDRLGLAQSHGELIKAGRLELTGPIESDALGGFYRGVDCVVMTETHAGWSNVVAEAMACGVPVICTPHGTNAIAHHEETALVMETPTAKAIAENIRRLKGDLSLCRSLAEKAEETISPLSWESYARQTLRLIRHDGIVHYLHAPEIGQYGKWSIDERRSGLDPLLERARGMSVIDFGAAEGILARECLMQGATRVHGFELAPHRVRLANSLCEHWKGSEFRVADLSDWKSFQRANADLLEEAYDIVLYLGIHQHLPVGGRLETVKGAIQLARRYFAIRTPASVYDMDGLDALIEQAGLRLLGAPAGGKGHLGTIKIFERIHA